MPISKQEEELKKSLSAFVEFQEKEGWRKGTGDKEIYLSGASFSAYEDMDKSGHSKQVLDTVTKKMQDKTYLVVQEFSEEVSYDGSLPLTVSLAKGKDMGTALAVSGIENAYVYGPSMASEIDDGYDSGTRYLMDIDGLPAKAQRNLLVKAQDIVNEMEEAAQLSAGGGYRGSRRFGRDDYEPDFGMDDGYGDDGYGDEYGSLAGSEKVSVKQTVNMILSEAYDNGAKSPYAAVRDTLERETERLHAADREREAREQEAAKAQEPAGQAGGKAAGLADKPLETASTKVAMQASVAKDEDTGKPVAEAKDKSVGKAARTATVKPIFFKPGTVKPVKGSDGKTIGYVMPVREPGHSDANVFIAHAGVGEDGKKTYSFRILFNSAKFRNWGVAQDIRSNALFEVRAGNGAVIRKIGAEEVRKVSHENNRKYDRAHGKAQERDREASRERVADGKTSV